MKVYRVILFSLLIITSGCSLFNFNKKTERPVRFSEISGKGIESLGKVYQARISRKKFKLAAQNDHLLTKIRMIEILRPTDARVAWPEYRLLGFLRDSPYHILGLRNNDVLVAVDGYVVWDKDKFPQYMLLIQDQPGGEITVRRAGQIYTFRFVFDA